MTYGLNAPKGFQPGRTLGGYTYTGALNEYPITATNANSIFTGDPVSLSTLGTVQRGAASTPILGVFMGCKYLSNPAAQYGAFGYAFWPGNPGVVTGNTPVALIADDPNAIWTIQETDAGSASGTPLTQGAVGLNANFLYTAGSTVTGLSAVSLNNASTATTLVGNVQIVALDPSIVIGAQAATPTAGTSGQQVVGAFANWLVKANTNFYAPNVRPV